MVWLETHGHDAMAVHRPEPLPRLDSSKRTYVDLARNWRKELASFVPNRLYNELDLQDYLNEVRPDQIKHETERRRCQLLNMFIDDDASEGVWEISRILG